MEEDTNGCLGELKNELSKMLNVVILPEMSGHYEQCIYKVPLEIRQANPQTYTPRIISIGPFHSPCGSSSDNILHQMEQFKLKYLKGFLNRTRLSLNELVFKFQELENRIRSCYAVFFSFNSNDFLKIIIIDACFIIEHFLRYYEYQTWNETDPIFLKLRLREDILYDLILLENQIPFFVLEDIYKLTSINHQSPSFLTITIHYFQDFNPLKIINPLECRTPKHFTDLLRTFLVPPSFHLEQEEMEVNSVSEEQNTEIYGQLNSVSQLSEAGLVFGVSESNNCLLNLKFDDTGILKMPCFIVHNATERHMGNISAFEECHFSDLDSRYVSQYLSILHFLINTDKDVRILVDKKIIVNLMGDANEVATMFNNLCKNKLVPDQLNSKYKIVCHRLNRISVNHPINKCKLYKDIFVRDYFNTPWKIASTVTAVLLVLLTLTQTVCSILSLL